MIQYSTGGVYDDVKELMLDTIMHRDFADALRLFSPRTCESTDELKEIADRMAWDPKEVHTLSAYAGIMGALASTGVKNAG